MRCGNGVIRPALSSDMKFVQSCSRKSLCVSNIRKIVPCRRGGGKARDVGSKKRVANGFFVAAKTYRDTVVLRCIKVKLAHILIYVVFSRPQRKYLATG